MEEIGLGKVPHEPSKDSLEILAKEDRVEDEEA